MPGRRNPQLTMLAFIDLEERVPTSHPLRTIKRLADEALSDLSSTFDEMYGEKGAPRSHPSGC
jgi:transposase